MPINSNHPVFSGVTSLKAGNGQYINDLHTNPNSSIIQYSNNKGVYAAYSQEGQPEDGNWSVVFDSKFAQAEWGRINWNAQVCGDGALTVTAASSEDGTSFGAPQTVTRGEDLTVANGRYLKISVLFKRATTGESPVLYDLSVGTDGYTPPVSINATPTVDAGADQLIALANPAKLKGSVCDDALPLGKTMSTMWSKVSGPGTVTFTAANAIVTQAKFDQVGTYVLRLTANDGEKAAADDITITVENNNRPPVITSLPVTQGYSTRAYKYPSSPAIQMQAIR